MRWLGSTNQVILHQRRLSNIGPKRKILGLLLLQQLECPFLYYDRIGGWHTPRTLLSLTISIGLSFRVSICQLRRCSYFYQNPPFVVGPITEMACTIQQWSTQYHKKRDHEKKAQVLKKVQEDPGSLFHWEASWNLEVSQFVIKSKGRCSMPSLHKNLQWFPPRNRILFLSCFLLD